MALGPVFLDVAGLELTEVERQRLLHPLVGGVILFARNFAAPEQLAALTQSLHALRTPRLLIAVDHEGGRVQRFRSGFTQIPPMRALGRLWDDDQRAAREAAKQVGYVIGCELAAYGIDFSFTPVLDLDYGESSVIGDRALHRDPDAVGALGASLVAGLKQAGMGAVGKHFPGHGFVRADSHHEVPVDEREFADIAAADLLPFERLVRAGLPAVMPAHVIYPKIDSVPAGFSRVWLQDVLRRKMGFDGVIFSDDLSMAGAGVVGGPVARAVAALAAGCDMVLLCNDAERADELLAGLDYAIPATAQARLIRMHGHRIAGPLATNALYAEAVQTVARIGARPGDLFAGKSV